MQKVNRFFRNRNIANTLWNLLDTFLYPVLFFCTTPFFIHRLGTGQFGVWMLINTVVVSMQLFNFGIGSGVLRNVAFYAARQDAARVRDITGNAISLTLVLMGAAVFIAGVMALVVYKGWLFPVDADLRPLCIQSLFLAGPVVGFKFFEQVFTSYFKALEKFRKAMSLSSGSKLIALLLNLLLLHLLPLQVVHLLLVILLVNGLFLLVAFRMLYRDLQGFRFVFNIKQSGQERRFAFFTWLQSLAVILTFQADRYMVVTWFGLAVLSYYAVTATVFNHLHMGLSALLPWLAPRLTRLYALNTDGRELYLAARNLVAACSLVFMVLLYLLYPYLFPVLLGAATFSHMDAYIQCFIVFELFFALNIVPAFYFNAMGQERKYFYFLLFFSIATLAAMLLSLLWWPHPLAVLYGLIISGALCMLVQNLLLEGIQYGRPRLLQSFLLLLPQLCMAVFILAGAGPERWLAFVAGILSLYFVYIRGNGARFKSLLWS